MSATTEAVVIGVLVLGAVVWAVRAAWRSIRQTGGCSSCASSGDCPLVKNPEALIDLTTSRKPNLGAVGSACPSPGKAADKATANSESI